MNYPHKNFPRDWNLAAGYGFGSKTVYGYHEALDVNDYGGGNSDLGRPIYAEADGVIDLVHFHTFDFGRHYFLKVVGPWGTRWIHHAHCNEIFVKQGDKVREGQLIATIGNSGTPYAHDHWAVCKQLTGDNVANNLVELHSLWEDPVVFIERWKSVIVNPPMPTDPDAQPMPVVRGDLYQGIVRMPMTDGEKHFRETQTPKLNTIQLADDLLRNDGRARAYWAQVWGLTTKPDITSFSDDQLLAELKRRLG